MIHPDTRLVGISEAVGVGMIATRPIPAGTVIWARDPLDQRISGAAYAALPEVMRERFTRHAYLDDDAQWVLCWDGARFMNHACDYNCVFTPWGVEIAWRPIAAGEQLTNDYALLYLADYEEFDCLCGAAQCRGHIDSRQPEAVAPLHAQRLRQALNLVDKVRQPLWPLLDTAQIAQLQEAARDAA
ncbi:SET domain-containing protein [Massilia sp. TS11]|uniref:SET domain-containing protein n=1 Tax=Massilia sp. TS11 TaxID=2908003 RepID=UPI001EDAB403|nr:SET domain-containing protein-lysine N-methyltransferase [Massilia sp. TS11]MCG2586478.1 SET domain-containing protein-lysine N-methyltransferase [Massilia sp. TS11]